MCILCVIQKWSRRVATMLPWLVIPLIGLWALSQLLPPAFRFEITSPRLACVFVLLVTLFWYEILMPQLSAWRVRRNAQLRERKRFEAIELQKLRKTATRRCRNCLTAYRDQNPGGGKFMCSYCGHVSKRPVLDLSLPPSDADNGIIKELVGKGGKILNGKAWNDNGWMCSQDWLEHGNWVAGKSSYWRKNGSMIFGGDEFCLAEKSYSGALFFTCNLLTSFFMSIRWIWRKLFRFNSSDDEATSDEHGGMLAKRSDNGVNGNESRGEKARRKAEEKRQARLEKELLEEEERKQREEVARLVDERRRLRDEKLEAEKDRSKTLLHDKESKRETEKRRQERRKDKDKGSSKSNSDAEELEKKAVKESERKREVEKKNDNVKAAGSAHGTKNGSANSFNQENVGTRYLDRMRGTLLSSSRAFSGRGFFLRGAKANTLNITTKENKIHSSIDHAHSCVHRRDVNSSERIAGKGSINGDDKNIIRHVPSEPLPTAPKKSWQQLFTRSSSPPPMPNINVISKPNSKPQSEFQIPRSNGQSSAQIFDNPINFGLPLPFIPPVYTTNGTTSSSLGFSPAIEPVFPRRGERTHESTPEDVYEDPCYDPDPKSLLGPVSESLDNFHLDLGLERSRFFKNPSPSPEIHKPSPIESPLSRLRMVDEKLNHSNWSSLSTPPKVNTHKLPENDANADANGSGTWHMWSSSPLGENGLGLLANPTSLFSPQGPNRVRKEEFLFGTHSPHKGFHASNSQNSGPFSPPVTGSGDPHQWLHSGFFSPTSGIENNFSLKPNEEFIPTGLTYGNSHISTTNHSSEMSPTNSWAKKEQRIPVSREECVGNQSNAVPRSRNLFPNSNVDSLWSSN